MKKLIFIIMMAACSLLAMAQEQGEKKLILKNGTTLTGIVEVQTDGSYQLKTATGDILYFAPSEVERVTDASAKEKKNGRNTAMVSISQPRKGGKALGARLGFTNGASYQHWLGKNFLEVDADTYVNSSGITASAIYDFRILLSNQVALYAGPGIIGRQITDYGFYFGVAGQIGVEWEIPSVPFNVSVDWIPVYLFGIGLLDYSGVALGIRYRF